MPRRTLPILLVLLSSLAWAGPAMAKLDAYQQMVVDYVKNGGRFDACKYSPQVLKDAKNATPVDQNQYSASFVAALDDAIAARAQGKCNKTSQTPATTQGTTPPVAPPAGTTPPPPPAAPGNATTPGSTTIAPSTQTPAAPAQAQAPPTPTSEPTPVAYLVGNNDIALASNATDVATDAPFPVLALAILCALLALGMLSVGLVRWFAWEPAWTIRARHAAGEAGWRASSTWSDFTDYVRLGR